MAGDLRRRCPGSMSNRYAAMFGFDKLKEALGQIKKNNE